MKNLCLLLLLVFYGQAQAKPIKVVLFYPRSETFWNRLVVFAQEAATDLNMEFKAVDGQDDHFQMRKDLLDVIKYDKPDVVVFNNFKGIAPYFIETTNQAKVHSLLINSDLAPENKAKMGEPRHLYPFWIGQLLPDEEQAGIQIANLLFTKAKIIFGINGVRQTGAAMMREAALRQALAVDKMDLKQIFYANEWARLPAAFLTEGGYKRYPNIQGIWTANFSLALGALDGLEKLGLQPGKDIYVTAYDIPGEILGNIENGKILATAGGHFIEGAFAMIIIFDYLNGIDTPTKIQTPMAIITQKNVGQYLKKINDIKLSRQQVKKINFKLYSKKYSGKKSYHFNLETIIKQL